MGRMVQMSMLLRTIGIAQQRPDAAHGLEFRMLLDELDVGSRFDGSVDKLTAHALIHRRIGSQHKHIHLCVIERGTRVF